MQVFRLEESVRSPIVLQSTDSPRQKQSTIWAAASPYRWDRPKTADPRPFFDLVSISAVLSGHEERIRRGFAEDSQRIRRGFTSGKPVLSPSWAHFGPLDPCGRIRRFGGWSSFPMNSYSLNTSTRAGHSEGLTGLMQR